MESLLAPIFNKFGLIGLIVLVETLAIVFLFKALQRSQKERLEETKYFAQEIIRHENNSHRVIEAVVSRLGGRDERQ